MRATRAFPARCSRFIEDIKETKIKHVIDSEASNFLCAHMYSKNKLAR